MGYTKIKAQQYNSNLEFFARQATSWKIECDTQSIHSSFKPFIVNKFSNIIVCNSDFYNKKRDCNLSKKLKSRWIYRKLRSENFLEYKSSKFSIIVNPLLNIGYTKLAGNDHNYFINSRGIELKGHIGKRISYYTSFYENQARFVPYIADYVRQHLVAPGQGAVKILKDDKFDFSRAEAYLNIKINKNLCLQFGHGKHFVGNGYRSLLLSDNSFSYPYLRINFAYKKWKYTLLWSQYQIFKTAYYNYHNRKYSAISHLSWLPNKGFELSLFESVMWAGNTPQDSRKLNLNFFNPIILSRTAIYGLDNEKNVLLGIDARVKLYKYARLFAQFALDNIAKKSEDNNNYAFQIGIKHYDLLHNKVPNTSVFVQAEFNYISEYTYGNEKILQSYWHYNQPLTHPAGSGLQEYIAIFGVAFRDFTLNSKLFYIKNNANKEDANFKNSIFMPNITDKNIILRDNNQETADINRKILKCEIELAYTINPVNNLQVFASWSIHSLSNNYTTLSKQKFLSFGLRTNINNYYYDF